MRKMKGEQVKEDEKKMMGMKEERTKKRKEEQGMRVQQQERNSCACRTGCPLGKLDPLVERVPGGSGRSRLRVASASVR
jgi:hypothetical protein